MNRRNNSSRIGLIAVLCFSWMSLQAAELDSVVKQLRSEPMSMFDWGMYQLERDLQQVRRDDRDFLRVFHSPRKNLLIIDASFVVLPAEIAEVTAKTACYSRLHAIKLILGVIDTSEIHFAPSADYRLGLKFSHQDPDDLELDPSPEQIGQALMSATEIRVAISSEKMEFPFSPDLRCSGELLSQVVRYDGVDDVH